MSGITVVVVMFLLIFCGVPVVFSLLGSTALYFIINGIPLGTFCMKFCTGIDSFSLIAMPFFVLAGNLMSKGGISRRLFALANALFGWMKAGLCYVTIVSNAIFSAISGSAMANAASVGLMSIEEMKKQGYEENFSTSLVASSCIMGPIIPPSTAMIIYGVAASVSVSKLFLGGLLPGILLATILAIACHIIGRNGKIPAVHSKFNVKEVWITFKDAIWALLMPIIILGGVFSGIFTATESGAIACFYAVIVGLFVYRDMTFKDIVDAVFKAGKSCGVILIISGAAAVLGYVLTIERVPQTIASIIATTISSKYILMLIFLVLYIFLGCIMGATAIIITTVPIFAPICTLMGIDLIYFGVFLCIVLSLGSITPPVGAAMYVLLKEQNLKMEKYTKEMAPWFLTIVVFCIILIFVPQIVTLLPSISGIR